MNFSRKILKDEIILKIHSHEIDGMLLDEILSCKKKGKKLGLDMKNVRTIKTKKFVKCLLKNDFRLFNLQNDILVYLSISLKDGFLKSHMNLSDFCKNKRELVKRHFLVA